MELCNEKFGNVEVLNQFYGTIRMRVRDENVDLATLFAAAEEFKQNKDNHIEDYSVSHTTLEQVFLEFAKNSEEFNEDS